MNEAGYREWERELWRSVGLSPSEQRVRLAATGTTVRVQSVGDGDPVLFLHGVPNSGSTWAGLLPHLPGFRALLVDRPGTGLSDDYVVGPGELLSFADRIIGDLLDALEIESAHVVASSFGGFLSLRSGATSGKRFRRMVQMACPAFAPGMQTPKFMQGMRFAFVRWLVPKLPPTQKANDDIMRQIGHGASLDAQKLPAVFSRWYMGLQRHTNTMKNDLAMIGGALKGKAFDPAFTLSPSTLSAVQVPTHFLWGEDDTFGAADVARAVVGAMPRASLEMLPRCGHLPWLDEPASIGAKTAAFLRG